MPKLTRDRGAMRPGAPWTGGAISFVRAGVGLLFVCHGAASSFGVLGGAHPDGGSVPLGAWPGWYGALIQVIGGGLVLIGLATRPAALICSGSMAYAYFVVHQPAAVWPIQNHGEAAAMFALVFLLIAAVGPGPVSLDGLMGARRRPAARVDPSGELAARAG